MTSSPTLRRLLRLALMLGLLAMLAACSKVVTLQSNLTDADANEIVMLLSKQGIPVEKKPSKEGVNLVLADTDLARATTFMQGAGLPRRGRESLGEVFKKQGMISTPLEERIRYLHGLSEELGFTLQQFDNVISARVHVVLPERIAPGEPIQPSSAAVFIKYRPPMDEDAIVPRVQRLVASSIPGLSGEDGRSKVAVVLTPGEAAAPGLTWTTVGPFKVHTDSAGGLLGALIGAGVLGTLGLAGCGWTLWQRRSAPAPSGKRGKADKGKADKGAADVDADAGATGATNAAGA